VTLYRDLTGLGNLESFTAVAGYAYLPSTFDMVDCLAD
jgi:hypothetical protein